MDFILRILPPLSLARVSSPFVLRSYSDSGVFLIR